MMDTFKEALRIHDGAIEEKKRNLVKELLDMVFSS